MQNISFSGVLQNAKGIKSWVLFYFILYFITLVGFRPTQCEEALAGVISPLRDTLPHLSIPTIHGRQTLRAFTAGNR